MLDPKQTSSVNFNGNARDLGGAYRASVADTPEIVNVCFVPVAARATFIENLDDNSELDRLPIVATAAELQEIDKYRIFEVEGDSMLPTIVNGALILAKEIPEQTWHYAEGVVVAVYADFVVVKRIIKNDLLMRNTLVLGSDNARYGEMAVQLSDIRALYKAKRIISSEII